MEDVTLQWRHNERDGVANHRSLDCILNRLFRRRSKKTSKLCVTGLCGERWIPRTKGQWRGKCFHLMTSSWLFHHLVPQGKQSAGYWLNQGWPRLKLCKSHENLNILLFKTVDAYTIRSYTVYPKKYAHGFVVLCFVVVMQSFIMNSHEVFIHIHQGCFAGTGAIVRLPQCQWSKSDGYGKISPCITTTKHSKAKTVCIFLGIYCKFLIRKYLLSPTCISLTRTSEPRD